MSCLNKSGPMPVVSLLCSFFLSCVIACLSSFSAAAASLACGLAIFFCFGQKDGKIWRSMRIVNFFLVLIWLIVPWTTPGPAALEIFFLKISETGLRLCLLITVKANVILLVFWGTMGQMNPMQLGSALAQLHFPDKLTLMLVLSCQQIDHLKSEWKKLLEGALLKGFKPSSTIHGWRTIAAMLSFLLARAAEKAEKLYESLLLRSFTGKFPVTADFVMDKRDWLLIGLTFFSAMILIFLNVISFYA